MTIAALILVSAAALLVGADLLGRLVGQLRARRDRRARERLYRAGVVSMADRRGQLRRIERSSWARRPIDPLRVNRRRDPQALNGDQR